MSYKVHIPIDDISEADLEADLREVAKLGADHRSDSVQSSRPHENIDSKEFDFPAHGSDRGYDFQPKYPNKQVVVSNSGVTLSSEGEITPNRGDKVFSDLDLAMARKNIERSRNALIKEEMKEASWRGKEAVDRGSQDELRGFLPVKDKQESRLVGTKNDKDVASKRTFVNSLRKQHQKKLSEAAKTTPSAKKSLQDLMSDLKAYEDDDETNNPKLSSDELADDIKIKKYKNVKLKDESNTENVEVRPYEAKKKKNEKKASAEVSGDVTGDGNPEDGIMTGNLGRGKGVNGKTQVKNKHKKHRKHKKVKQAGHSKDSDIDNTAVSAMINEDRKTYRNESALFRLVDKGRDRVDLPLSDSGGAWLHKVHGRRDIVVAGSIVMCLGVIVIVVSLFALVRKRFIRSTRRKGNINNNKMYRRLGSASETEILRKPQRSLFSVASSEEDDDDDDDDDDGISSSDEEIIYHQKKIDRNFQF